MKASTDQKKTMVFIVVPAGKYPKTRKQLAKDSGKKDVLNMSLPVFYTDEDSHILFTDLAHANAYALSKYRGARFIAAGGKQRQ
jgi:hypothetical protein